MVDNFYVINRIIEEDIIVLYFEFDFFGELNGMEYNLLIGLCYENIDVMFIVNISLFSGIVWEGNNDFNVCFGSVMEDVEVKLSYDYIFFVLDFDIEVVENVIVCFFYSKIIVRFIYNSLSVVVMVNILSGLILLIDGVIVIVSLGNLILVLLELDNVDVLVEYYFDEISYVLLGFYDKCVKNFIGNE